MKALLAAALFACERRALRSAGSAAAAGSGPGTAAAGGEAMPAQRCPWNGSGEALKTALAKVLAGRRNLKSGSSEAMYRGPTEEVRLAQGKITS